jgi:hypothetical protein
MISILIVSVAVGVVVMGCAFLLIACMFNLGGPAHALHDEANERQSESDEPARRQSKIYDAGKGQATSPVVERRRARVEAYWPGKKA